MGKSPRISGITMRPARRSFPEALINPASASRVYWESAPGAVRDELVANSQPKLGLLDGVGLKATARQIVQRLAVDQEAISVQLHSRAEYLQGLGPRNRPALLRMHSSRLPTGLGPDGAQGPSTQALNRLAERQVLDLLYEPDPRHRAPDT
jgi:hypothetical protein